MTSNELPRPTSRLAYYECGGVADLTPGDDTPETCPHDGCDAGLTEVVDV